MLNKWGGVYHNSTIVKAKPVTGWNLDHLFRLVRQTCPERMDKRMEAQARMVEAMGLNEHTARHLM